MLDLPVRKLDDRDVVADLAHESYVRVFAFQRSGELNADPPYHIARNLVVELQPGGGSVQRDR